MANKTIKQVMTPTPATMKMSMSCKQAAQMMRDKNIGAILVEDDKGEVGGILTDRDMAIRCVAEGHDPSATPVGDICSREIAKLAPDDEVHVAVELMKKKAIRRVPVMANGKAVGMLSLGDLAEHIDPKSALGQISTATPNR